MEVELSRLVAQIVMSSNNDSVAQIRLDGWYTARSSILPHGRQRGNLRPLTIDTDYWSRVAIRSRLYSVNKMKTAPYAGCPYCHPFNAEVVRNSLRVDEADASSQC